MTGSTIIRIPCLKMPSGVLEPFVGYAHSVEITGVGEPVAISTALTQAEFSKNVACKDIFCA